MYVYMTAVWYAFFLRMMFFEKLHKKVHGISDGKYGVATASLSLNSVECIVVPATE